MAARELNAESPDARLARAESPTQAVVEDAPFAGRRLRGRPYHEPTPSAPGIVRLGTKCRMAEYQASILLTQMETFEAECRQRSENAAYLTEKLAQIPGIVPRKDYAGVTRTAFYYYGFRYQQKLFDGLSREKFIAALRAEGVEADTGLGVISGKPINKEGCLEDAFRSKAYQLGLTPDEVAAVTEEMIERWRQLGVPPAGVGTAAGGESARRG